MSACTTGRHDYDALLAKGIAQGIMRASGTHYDVDEGSWAQFTHNGKIALAVAAFCQKMAPNGSGIVRLVGLHDGKTLASVVDGNYSD